MKTLASILILFCTTAALADTAEFDATYFHPAASLYIHGDSAGASNLVERGLSANPDDGKLRRLRELLKQQQQQNQKDQQQNDQKNQNQEQQDDKQNQQQDQGQDQQNQQQDGNQPQERQPEPQPQPVNAEQMTEDEAEQLLDAMRQEEQNKRMQLRPVMGVPVRVGKDW